MTTVLRIGAATLLPLYCCSVLAGQVVISPEELSRGLRASDATVRMRTASAALAALRDGRLREVVARPVFESALLAALRDANDLTKQRYVTPDNSQTLEAEEGHAEYVNELGQLAMEAVPLLPPDRQGAWAHELIRSAYSPDSLFASWLAQFGDYVVDGLIEQTKRPEIDVDRPKAHAVLAQVVGITAAGARSGQPVRLASERRQRALEAVIAGLELKDQSAREIVRAFQRNPSPELLTILEDFSRRARGQPAYVGRRGQRKSLQDEVDGAIQQMRVTLR
jgi:hypothetical protein